MISGYIPIDGSKIYYEITGVGEPMIFVHADTLDHRQWEKQVEYFSKHFQVITYDIRGFGKSEIPSDVPYSFSEDLNQLMIALKIEKAHLVGLSLGSAIIIDFALTHPEKVISLVLADAGIGGDGFKQEFIDSIKSVVKLAKEHKLQEAKQAWLALNIFDYSRKQPEVWQSIETMVADTSCYRWIGENQPVNIKSLAAERLLEITAPTLVVIGEHDIDDFQRKAHLLNEQIANSQLLTIPNAGHLSNLDNPDILNTMVFDFVTSL